jgi:hypothetical protein
MQSLSTAWNSAIPSAIPPAYEAVLTGREASAQESKAAVIAPDSTGLSSHITLAGEASSGTTPAIPNVPKPWDHLHR